MNLKKYNLLFVITAFLVVFVLMNQRPKYIKIEGDTQGTKYHITYKLKRGNKDIKPLIDKKLKEFDKSLSTYSPTSTISKVNANEDVEVDSLFIKCFNESLKVWKASDGLFDITVAPLATAYGFGPGKRDKISDELIDSLLQFVGLDKVHLEGKKVIKQNPNIRLDVNAIAQGLSVDYICDFFDSLGAENYMVEIGGELKAKGLNPEKNLWRIGIDKPIEGNMQPGVQLQQIISIKNKALATSGNYRKFYERGGKKYTHTINPKTGQTVQSDLLSATVITKDCITADAFATACMASGFEKAKKLIKDNDLNAYFIYSDEEGGTKVWMTDFVRGLIDADE